MLEELFGGIVTGWVLVAMVALVVAVFLLSLTRPILALALALMGSYNPIYSLHIQTTWWVGGRIRVLISVFCVAAMGLGLFMRSAVTHNPIYRARTPIDRWLFAYLFFPLLGILNGIWRNNDLRLILADSTVFFELYAYFLLTTLIVEDRNQARKLARAIVAVGVVNATAEVIFYLLRSESLTAGFYIFGSGMIVPRIQDVMVSILLPFAVGIFLYANPGTSRTIVGLSSSVFLVLMVLTFTRGQWLGFIASLAFISWVIRKTINRVILRNVQLVGVLLLALILVGWLVTKLPVLPASLSDLIYARATYLTPGEREGKGRWDEAMDLLVVIQDYPLLGKGMGGLFSTAKLQVGAKERERDSIVALGGTHNFYLGLAGQIGLPGLIAFFSVVLLLFKAGLSRFHSLETGLDKGILLGILGSFVSIGVYLSILGGAIFFPIGAFWGVQTALIFCILPEADLARAQFTVAHHLTRRRTLSDRVPALIKQ